MIELLPTLGDDARPRYSQAPQRYVYRATWLTKWYDILFSARHYVWVGEDHHCDYSTIVREPYRANSAILRIGYRNLLLILGELHCKGKVKVRASYLMYPVWVNGVGQAAERLSEPCRLSLEFSDKRSAMMFKLAYG